MKLIQPKTWYAVQWISTLLFITTIIVSFNRTCIVIGNIPIKFTILTIVSFIALLVSQSYVYGYYIKNSSETVLYPFFAILLSAFVDLLFSYLLSRLDLFIPYYKNLFIYYISLILCSAFNLIVYSRVEFIEINTAELYKIENGTYEVKTEKEKRLENKYI